jgi:Flp pilus assembly protein TadG
MKGRRGNQAIEFAITVPILLILLSGIIDLGHYMWVADGLVNTVAQAGRLGALTNSDDEDPVVVSTGVANASWAASELPGTLTFVSAISGTDPDAFIVVSGTVPLTTWFGFLNLPTTVSYTHTVRLMYQPDP